VWYRNKLELHLQEVVAHELLSRTLQIVGHEIKLKKLHLSTDFAATIDRLNADPARYTPAPSACQTHFPLPLRVWRVRRVR